MTRMPSSASKAAVVIPVIPAPTTTASARFSPGRSGNFLPGAELIQYE